MKDILVQSPVKYQMNFHLNQTKCERCRQIPKILGHLGVCHSVYTWFKRRVEDVSKCFRTGRLERELQMVQLSATRCSCIAIL